MATSARQVAGFPIRYAAGMLGNPASNTRRLLRWVIYYLAAWTIGNFFGILFWSLQTAGVIRIDGRDRLMKAADQGHLLIAVNHPTLIETLLLPALGWPHFLISRRYFFWSVPDRKLFPKGLKWVYAVARGIPIDRNQDDESRRFNIEACKRMIEVLKDGDTIITHVEGGRTFKHHSDRGVKLLGLGEREISEIKPGIFPIAVRSKALILPGWIEMSKARQLKRNYRSGFLGLFRPCLGPIVFHFEHDPYRVYPGYSTAAETAKLTSMLLSSEYPLPTMAKIEVRAI